MKVILSEEALLVLGPSKVGVVKRAAIHDINSLLIESSMQYAVYLPSVMEHRVGGPTTK